MGFLSSSIAKLLPFSRCRRGPDANGIGQPALVLKNESAYVVSFWVFQEDKLKTMSRVTEAGTGIGGTLKIGCKPYPLATANMAKTTRSITVQQKDTFYLLRDLRVGAEGTTVPFPKDCRELRVVGYVNRRSGKRGNKRVLGHYKKYFSRKKWKLFKDEVYSIGRGDTIFTVVAKDQEIQRYI